MKDTLHNIGQVTEESVANLGWTPGALKSAMAATALDGHRFLDENGQPDRTQNILSRYGEDAGARYPDSQELAANGCDLVVLLEAAVDGLDLDTFGKAVQHGLGLADFCAMLAQKIDSMDEVNGMMELFIESGEETNLHPDALVRNFVRLHTAGGFACHA